MTEANGTVYAQVREKIRQDILTGYFKPGSRITTATLGARYGVSQMPIREALQQLQGEGLVTIVPNRGARVREVNEEFIRNIYDIRAALEAMMVRRAVEACDSESLDPLREAEARYAAAVARQDMDAALEANRDFHDVTFRLARNPEAVEAIARHSELLQSLRRRFGYGPERLAEIVFEHRQLVRAFEQKDVGIAVAVVMGHCERAKHDLIAQAAFDAPASRRGRNRTKETT
jgi:DNA-binding GntR family transcriptional regulator